MIFEACQGKLRIPHAGAEALSAARKLPITQNLPCLTPGTVIQ